MSKKIPPEKHIIHSYKKIMYLFCSYFGKSSQKDVGKKYQGALKRVERCAAKKLSASSAMY